jgi:hypothetical protein
MPDRITTLEAAKQIGISRQSLYWWFRLEKIDKPQQIKIGSRTNIGLVRSPDIPGLENQKEN